MTDLHTAGHRRGVVARAARAAAEAGRAILAEGGNALEAMVAMAATIAAVYPHMNHIGGDGFWLVREPNGRVRAIMAAGRPARTPRRRSIASTRRFPPRGPLAALTVPGAVGGWMLALEAARAVGGKGCRSTCCWTPRSARRATATWSPKPGAAHRREARRAEGRARLRRDIPARRQAAGGRRDAEAERARRHARSAARNGLDDFYRGDVGREIAADLERIGSPVTRADLRHYHASVAEPLSVTLDAGTLYNTPPPTQGLASLIILALFERLRVREAESFELVHGLVEATKRAFRVRDRVVTDPARVPQPPAQFLDAKFLDAEVRKIDRRKAAKWPAPAGEGDTIWMGAADASGLVVSYIQSLYWEFGSGCVLPRTGVLMQNRGASFSLDRKALNPLAPGRLPFHTLNPALAVLNDGRVMAYGTMGGDGQPQTQAALFTRHVLHGSRSTRRSTRRAGCSAAPGARRVTNLRMESRFDGHLVDRLMSAGHDVEVLPDAYSDTMGHAGAVVLHPDGTLEGAHDPRADGGAAGFECVPAFRR